MTEIAKLIERLENAEAGSRELDAEIALCCFPHEWHDAPDNPLCMTREDYRADMIAGVFEDDAFLPASRSLDAAVALVERLLPGQEWSIGSNQPVLGEPWARIRTALLRTLEDSAPTPALALCLATLKALEARDKSTI